MSKFLLTDAKVVVNDVNLIRPRVQRRHPAAKQQVDVSGFNPTRTREFLPGQADQTITVQFRRTSPPARSTPRWSRCTRAGRCSSSTSSPTIGDGVATNPAFGGTATMYDYNGLVRGAVREVGDDRELQTRLGGPLHLGAPSPELDRCPTRR